MAWYQSLRSRLDAFLIAKTVTYAFDRLKAALRRGDPAFVVAAKGAAEPPDPAVAGVPGKLPPVWNDLALEIHLLERVVGVKDELTVEPVKPNEALMLNVNSAATVGIVARIKKDSIECRLKLPVCAEVGSRVTLSRMIGNRFRLIGYGLIKEKL